MGKELEVAVTDQGAVRWWNKYTAYHGLTPATNTSQTLAQRHPAGVVVGGAYFIFHRTLRVPEGGTNNLPAVRRS